MRNIFLPSINNFNVVESTNDVAFELLHKQQAVVVTAHYQTKGRGRNNKQWVGEDAKNLYYSFGLRHSLEEIPLHLLQMMGGLSVLRVLQSRISEDVFRLKYPNDVYVVSAKDGLFGKISGILSETNYSSNEECLSVIGIGINIFQKDFPSDIQNHPISLACLSGWTNNSSGIVQEISDDITKNIVEYLSKPNEEIMMLWRRALNLENKLFTIVSVPNSGDLYRFGSYLADGRIVLVSLEGEERTINNGDSIRYEL